MFSAIGRFLNSGQDSGFMVWIIIVAAFFGFCMDIANDQPARAQSCSKSGNIVAFDRSGEIEKVYIIGKCDPKTGAPIGNPPTFQKYGRG